MDKDALMGLASQALVALSPIVLAVLGWLSAEAARLINAKVKDARVRGVLLRLDDAVFTAVRETEQVMVGALKLASADGKLTQEEGDAVKREALRKLRLYMGAKGAGDLAKVMGLDTVTLEKFLSARLEACVQALQKAGQR